MLVAHAGVETFRSGNIKFCESRRFSGESVETVGFGRVGEVWGDRPLTVVSDPDILASRFKF